MNIIKFVKNINSVAAKDVARRDTLVQNIAVNIDSAQAIARVVHTAAYERWTPAARKELLASLKKHSNKIGSYAILSQVGRDRLIMSVANETKRSPCAVLIELRKQGECRVRGNSKATLASIAAKHYSKKTK